MKFYLGTDKLAWLRQIDVSFMVSRNAFIRHRKRLNTPFPEAKAPWLLDSGGFTELQMHGQWRIGPKRYAAQVRHIADTVGNLVWAAPQDWMCEPAVVHGGTFKGGSFVGTGLTVQEHQRRTVGNYLELKALEIPVIPVLQGFTREDYLLCAEMYRDAGVRLENEPVVGLGSVCRRENTVQIAEIVGAFHERGIRLHGFGCKTGAIRKVGALLESADSLAWSISGMREGTCTHLKSRCGSHLHWALEWRDRVLAVPQGDSYQVPLWEDDV